MKKYHERLIDQELVLWKDADEHKPLLIRGARQVGKSSAVRNLAKYFQYFVEVNFEKNKEVEIFFSSNLDPKSICLKLSSYFDKPILPKKTLLFFDEIQSCKPALESLRYFYEDYPELHLIAAGSLLEFALDDIASHGVGRIRSLFMYPFSFDEFLTANGSQELIATKKSANDENPISLPLHNRLLELLKIHLYIGGMPKVVSTFLEKQSLQLCQEEIGDIVETIIDDFNKYRKRIPSEHLHWTFNAFARFSSQRMKYTEVSSEMDSRQAKSAINLLIKSGLIVPATCSAANGIPLGAEANNKYQKYLFFDTGIMQYCAHLNLTDYFLSNDFEVVNKGFLAETFAGLELVKYSNPRHRPMLFFWQREDRKGNAEVDFLIENNYQIAPIEVKSGTKGSMQSLYYFMEQKKIEKGYRCSLENFCTFQQIEVIPLYALSNFYQS